MNKCPCCTVYGPGSRIDSVPNTKDLQEVVEEIKKAMDKKYLKCVDCGKDFYLKKEEVAFYESQGYDMPKRCFYHRKNKKRSKMEKARAAIVKVRG